MKTKEQILAWFKEQEWYQAFIKNIMNGKVNRSLDQLTEEEEKQSNIIQDAFDWNESNEGYNYWKVNDIMYNQWLNKNTKVCLCCHKELPVEDFYVKASAKDGLQPYCKECAKKKASEHQKKHPKKHQVITTSEVEIAPSESGLKIDTKPVDVVEEKVTEPQNNAPEKNTRRNKTLANSTPVEMIEELANRGYYGIIMYREHKIETIEHNGHIGTFEYDEEHKINLKDFLEKKEK